MEAYQRGVSSLFVTSVMLCLVGLCLVAALLNGNLRLTVLCLLVLAVMAGLRLWMMAGAPHLGFTIELEGNRLFPGESLQVNLSADNRRFLPLSFETHCPVSDGLRPVSDTAPLKAENTLLWFQALHLQWELQAVRRGVHEVGPVTLVSGDLLGFFVHESARKERFEAIVYPRLAPLHPFSLPKRDFFGVPGGESPVDDPVYILGTTDYHHGRPARHIHWKASARHNRLQQKVFEPTEQEKILFVMDASGFCDQSHEEPFEETLEVIASLAARFDGQGSAVGFLTNSTVLHGPSFIPVARNPFQIGALLEMLARMQMQSVSSIIDILRRNPVIPWGTTCVYFAFESTGETDLGMAALSRRRTPVVFLAYPNVCNLRDEPHREAGDKKRTADSRGISFR